MHYFQGSREHRLPSLGGLIYQFTHCFTLQTSDYDVFFYFYIDSASLATSFKKCNDIMTWGRLDLAVPFAPFTPNRQNRNQVVLEHLYRRTPATPSSKVV